METNFQQEKITWGNVFLSLKKIKEEDKGTESFENCIVFLNEAEKSLVLNYGCLFFEACS
jgi:hypothetical protein